MISYGALTSGIFLTDEEEDFDEEDESDEEGKKRSGSGKKRMSVSLLNQKYRLDS